MTRRLIASGLFVFAASALVLSSAPTWAADSRFSQSITDLPLSSLRQDQYSDAIDAYAAKGQYQKALDVADLGLRKNPKSAQLKFQRCVVLEKMGDTAQAKAAYETAQSLKSDKTVKARLDGVNALLAR